MTAKTAKPAEQQAASVPTEPHLNLYQKLAAITGEVGIIAKDGNNTEQHFKFIEYAAVAGRLRELFAKYGVVVVPSMPPLSEQRRETVTSKFGKEGTYLLLDMMFEIVNADDPKDRFSVTWTAEAIDYGDKATNKAATGALKYYLMRQFNISEKGDDPDKDSPERGEVQQAPAPAKHEPTPKDLIAYAGELLERKNITDRDNKVAIIQGIADVADMELLTINKLKAVIKVLREESAENLRTFYIDVADDATDESVPPVTDDELALADRDMLDIYADQEAAAQTDTTEPHDGTTVYVVPKFPGEGGKIIPPGMTKQINDWIQKLGWTDVEVATFMHGVINKPEPALRDDAQTVLDYLADELNARQASKTQLEAAA